MNFVDGDEGNILFIPPYDQLNEIGVLKRREIEARILAPLLSALGKAFDQEKVLEVAREVIVDIALKQGAELAASGEGCSLAHFAAALAPWQKGDSMEMEILVQDEQQFSFNVTRCRYAEMYRSLGIPELGVLLSCNRDAALIEGFNPEINLKRTQMIMEGAAFCDFRYFVESTGDE